MILKLSLQTKIVKRGSNISIVPIQVTYLKEIFGVQKFADL